MIAKIIFSPIGRAGKFGKKVPMFSREILLYSAEEFTGATLVSKKSTFDMGDYISFQKHCLTVKKNNIEGEFCQLHAVRSIRLSLVRPYVEVCKVDMDILDLKLFPITLKSGNHIYSNDLKQDGRYHRHIFRP